MANATLLLFESVFEVGRSICTSMPFVEQGDGAADGDEDKLEDELVLFVYNLDT